MEGCSESQETSRECQDVEEPAVPPAPEPPAKKFCWRAFLSFCGPGLLMSVAYLVRPQSRAPVHAPTRGAGAGACACLQSQRRRRGAVQDPGNLTADIQAGTQTGFVLLWWFMLVSLGCVSAPGGSLTAQQGALAGAGRFPAGVPHCRPVHARLRRRAPPTSACLGASAW